MTAQSAVSGQKWVRRRPGWGVVARKELTDHLLSARFVALLFILGLVAVGTVFAAATALRGVAEDATNSGASLFLKLFTVQADPVPFSFMTFLGFLTPILGIAYGFDAVSGERSQGTLPRLVSQPIHRDDVINGKFVAGLSVISVILVVIAFIVAGVGIVTLGVVPSAGDASRMLVWLIGTIAYVAVWLALATLTSVVLRSAATSAIVAIGIWLLLALFGSLLAQLAAGIISPVDAADPASTLHNAQTEQALSRVSPVVLYDDTSTAMLVPEVRTLGFVTYDQIDRALATPLSIDQSLSLVWPQLVGLIAITVVLFAVAYIQFMRQEIRA
ncbi:MAG: ABC transporter permease [Acidimicrobiia bacterium]|jgi:ABC-2 type transport system permease protein